MMGANSKIEWTHHTFNPWVGCTKVSPACDSCYAESWAKRTGHPELWNGERRRTKTWGEPFKWHRQARAAGDRHRVFCASLADVFDNQVPARWLDDLFDGVIANTPNLDWLLLTKRPQNIAKMLPADWGERGYANVWLGTTVENQEEADRRIPHLLAVPAVCRFLSCEPLLGPLNLTRMKLGGGWYDVLGGWRDVKHRFPGFDEQINWIICGGESGSKARPMHPDWARSLHKQCESAKVPFFFKQWGEWREITDEDMRSTPAHRFVGSPPGFHVVRVGKKAAGRLLDGREWNEFPRVICGTEPVGD